MSSSGSVPRLELAPLRRLVPALWAEWQALTFDGDGFLRDADTGRPLEVLRLVDGRHRTPGARYAIAPAGRPLGTFTLASDDADTLRGTLAADGWSADLALGPRWQVSARVDVRALLQRSAVPGWAIGLVGGAAATGDAQADPALLDHRGDVLVASGRAQRVAGELTVHVTARRETWDGRIGVHLHGRGLLGRLALRAGGSAVRRGVGQALDDFWAGAAGGVASLRGELARLDDRAAGAGGPQAWLHAELWRALRAAAEAQTPAPVTTAGPVPVGAAAGTAADDDDGVAKHGLGRRYARPVVLAPGHPTRMVLGTLHVRERGAELRAQVGVGGRAGSPPRFRGRIEQRPGGPVLVGRIRESTANALTPRLWGFVTAIMVLLAAFGVDGVVRGQHGALAPLLLGIIGGTVFGLFRWFFARARRPDFVRQSADLAAALAEWLAERPRGRA